MSEPSYVIDVNQHNFAQIVVENSRRVPVLVDFWADWCQPCQTLGPLLAKLAQDYRGGVLIAKVNADTEQALAAHFRVRSLPTVMVIWQGQLVDQLVGLQPESVYREMINRLGGQAAQPDDEPIQEQIEILWQQGRQKQAIALLHEALQQEPGNSELKVILADKLLQLDQSEEARMLLDSLPVEERDRQPASGVRARLQFAELAQGAPDITELEARLQTQADDCAVRQQLAARYVLAGRYETALEQFMDILRRDPRFGDGAGRRGLIAIFDILGNEDPLVTTYRRRLFSLLH